MGTLVGRALVASIVALIGLLAITRRRPKPRDVIVALCFLPLACASVRMIPWWLLTIAPVLAHALANALPRRARLAEEPPPAPTRRASVSFAVLCLFAAFCLPLFERFNPILGHARPATRTEYDVQCVLDNLDKTDRPARVFTRLEWGEYLDWAGRDRCRSFIDGRIEIYPDDVWSQYHAVTFADRQWKSIIDAHDVEYLILDRKFHRALLKQVDSTGEWRVLAQSGPAVLYGRATLIAGR
jgi:hypothetical protein